MVYPNNMGVIKNVINYISNVTVAIHSLNIENHNTTTINTSIINFHIIEYV